MRTQEQEMMEYRSAKQQEAKVTSKGRWETGKQNREGTGKNPKLRKQTYAGDNQEKTALESFHVGATVNLGKEDKMGHGETNQELGKTGSKANRTQINKIKQEIVRNMDPDTELFSLVY